MFVSTDQDEPFDETKIKVTVSHYDEPKIQSRKNPIIRLNRLTASEISKYTDPKLNKSERPTFEKEQNEGAGCSSKAVELYTRTTRSTTIKRRNDIKSAKLTNAKKIKLSKNLPVTEIQEISETQNTQLKKKYKQSLLWIIK